MISRRSLFSFLAGAPIGAVAAVKAATETPIIPFEFSAPVDPPVIVVGDRIVAPLNLWAGSITWVDPDYDERTGEVLRAIPIDRRIKEIEAKYMADGFDTYWKSGK